RGVSPAGVQSEPQAGVRPRSYDLAERRFQLTPDLVERLRGKTQMPAWRAERRLDRAAVHGTDERRFADPQPARRLARGKRGLHDLFNWSKRVNRPKPAASPGRLPPTPPGGGALRGVGRAPRRRRTRPGRPGSDR